MTRRLTPPPDKAPKHPALKVPAGACDSHFHIFGPQAKFPYMESRPLDAEDCSLEDLLVLQDRLGLERGVVVQTALYGNDNRCLLDALLRCPERFKGVAAVSNDITDDELQTLTNAGVVANRFSYMRSPDIDRNLISRLHELGWHPQFWFEGEAQILDWRDTMLASPRDFVIDHMGWQPCENGLDSKGFKTVLECLDTGRCWIKLSGPNRFSAQDEWPYSDTVAVARTLIQRAPERVIWGSDWPHPNWWKTMPNDADLLDLLLDWAPDPKDRQRILVDNPNELFRFQSSPD
ncbi:MAG: amidohydrolase family protein [Pseudomonadota bacterium]